MKRLTSDNKMLGYELMKAYPNISCFSTTRHGGCSKGNYASFNCNGYCGDEAEDVNRNRELLRSLLPGESVELVIPHQTHSDHVKVVDTIHVNTELEGVDALVTDIPGYCLCVSTADCVPVLLYDTRKKVVAAIHAGWRGTVARIVEKTVSVMDNQYGSQGKDLIACIGPSISLEAFEVGDEVYQAFCEAGFDMNQIARKEAKWHIDLWEANRQQLLAYGVKLEHIEISGICTYHNNWLLYTSVHTMFALPVLNVWWFATIIMIILGIGFSLVPSAMWPSVPKIIPEKQLGTAYALIFWVQNWGLMGVPALIGFVLNEYCKGPVVDGMQTYDYTLPMWIFAGFGVAALFFALWLKGENKKKGYGLELSLIHI